MRNQKLKKKFCGIQNGITLVALVVTIIVLLILAGVSLSLIMGNQGILRQATDVVDNYDEARIKEDVELAVAEVETEWYKEYYVEQITTKNKTDYIKENLEKGILTSSGAIIKLEDEKINYKDSEGNILAEGTFDESTGSIAIKGTTVGETVATLSSQITTDNYGDYVDLGTNYVKGNSIATGTATEDWRIFYKNTQDRTNKDGSLVKAGTYLILADYLPYKYETVEVVGSTTGLGTGLNNAGAGYTINWKSLVNREDLLLKLRDTSKWNKLISNDYIDKGIAVQGAIDLETWIASWNEKYNTGLDTEYNSIGYLVGIDSKIVTFDLSAKTGYLDTLYFPIRKKENINYYWLASNSAFGAANSLKFISDNGFISYDSNSSDFAGVRPVVYLPESVKAKKDSSGIWRIK